MPKREDIEADLIEELLERPEVQGLIDKASGILDKVSSVLDFVTKPKPPKPNGKNGHGRRPIPIKINPRVILGFGPTEELTVEKIKERRKKLALIMHGDKGGSDVAMARVNAATDMLLAKMK